MDHDDEFGLASTLQRALDRYLEDVEDVDEIDTEELAGILASDAEDHFGM